MMAQKLDDVKPVVKRGVPPVWGVFIRKFWVREPISEEPMKDDDRKVRMLIGDLDGFFGRAQLRKERSFDMLVKMGKDAVPILVKALRYHQLSRNTRQDIARILGEIRDPAAVPALIMAMRYDRNENDMVPFKDVLASALTGALTVQYGEGSVAYYAAEALGKIGDARAVPALISEAKGRCFGLDESWHITDDQTLIKWYLAPLEAWGIRNKARDALRKFDDGRASRALDIIEKLDEIKALRGELKTLRIQSR